MNGLNIKEKLFDIVSVNAQKINNIEKSIEIETDNSKKEKLKELLNTYNSSLINLLKNINVIVDSISNLESLEVDYNFILNSSKEEEKDQGQNIEITDEKVKNIDLNEELNTELQSSNLENVNDINIEIPKAQEQVDNNRAVLVTNFQIQNLKKSLPAQQTLINGMNFSNAVEEKTPEEQFNEMMEEAKQVAITNPKKAEEMMASAMNEYNSKKLQKVA